MVAVDHDGRSDRLGRGGSLLVQPGDASLEFQGGVTRKGKLVLGSAASTVCYAVGVPLWANVVIITGFAFWVVRSRDVQTDYDKFHKAARSAAGNSENDAKDAQEIRKEGAKTK
mmetsp:Transcript_13311/g.15254  ORF Transcript_13311/g.15254 Transcript_13311/m.15254 type:complete len:114 (+) Transcript_13311:81-422(+)